MEAKSLFQSKTFWAQIIALLAMVSTAAGVDLGLDEATQAQIIGGIMAVVNIILRMVTRAPVK